MRRVNSIKKSFINHAKMLSLWDIKSYLTKKQWIKIIIVMILNIINSIAKILAPASLAKSVEIFASGKTSDEVGPIVLEARHLLYISVILMIWTKSEIYLKNLLLKDVETRVTKKNAMKIIKLSHQIPIDEHIKLRPEITTMLMETMSMQAKFGTEVVTVVYQVLLDIVVGTSLIWNRYGALIAGEFLLFSLLEIVVLNHLVDFFTTHSVQFNNLNKAMYKFINHENQIIQMEETVRMFGHQQFEIDSSKKCLEKYLNQSNKFQLTENITAWIKLLPLMLTNIIPISFIIKDNISLADLDDFVFLLSYLNMFGGNVLSLNQSIKSCLRAIKSIETSNVFFSNLNLTKIKANIPILQIDKPINDVDYPSPEIKFENVTFAYPNCSKPTLKNITFKILPGTNLGIIGHSNAGKSTIVKLLYGIYKAQSGTIKINNHRIDEIPNDVLAKIFCCVPQRTDLFVNKSLKYNVLYGTQSDALLKNYLKKEKLLDLGNNVGENQPLLDKQDNLKMEEEGQFASAHQKTNSLFSQTMRKVQLHQLDNANATKKSSVLSLSGGQQQRVSLARALVRNSKIFILDEATESLDSFTESEVLKNGKEVMKGKTVIRITHRLATVKDADEIIVLENGEIIEQGSPKKLFQSRGKYYDYWCTQMSC